MRDRWRSSWRTSPFNCLHAVQKRRVFCNSPAISYFCACLITPSIPTLLTRLPRDNMTSVEVSPDALRAIAVRPNGRLIVPLTGSPPFDTVIARFLAKVALEYRAKGLFFLIRDCRHRPTKLPSRHRMNEGPLSVIAPRYRTVSTVQHCCRSLVAPRHVFRYLLPNLRPFG